MDELTRELTHLGLTEKEASVYLAAAELGPSVAQDIAKKAKVNRATTYVMIDTLKTRGLMSSYSKGKKKYFVAESPERLLGMIRLQRQELESREEEFARIMPQLAALYNVEGAKPQVRFLEGVEGMKTIREEMHAVKGEIIQLMPFDDVQDYFSRIMEADYERKSKKDLEKINAPVRSLVVVENEASIKNIPDFGKGVTMRILPADKFKIHGEIDVRGDRIVMFSYKSSLVAIVIVSQILADSMRVMFNLAWEAAKEYPDIAEVKKKAAP